MGTLLLTHTVRARESQMLKRDGSGWQYMTG